MTKDNTIILYNSDGDGDHPAASDLAYGELAINYENENLYYKNSGDARKLIPLGYLHGITSAVQTQLDAKQASDADLTAIAALAKSNGNIIVGNGSTWVAESGATARTSLGVDAAGTDNSTNVSLANTNYLSISGQTLTG